MSDFIVHFYDIYAQLTGCLMKQQRLYSLIMAFAVIQKYIYYSFLNVFFIFSLPNGVITLPLHNN